MVTKKQLKNAIENPLEKISLKEYKKIDGKVRDIFELGNEKILITTDRISAFDRVLGNIPFKGQVLNQLSEFWFDKTKKVVSNHLVNVPHPNVSVVKNAKPYPVEMVVRGYITGVTSTSIWKSYEEGERVIYGIKFPDGLRKNQKLQSPVITPTTKADKGAHDEKLTEAQILEKKLVPKKIWEQMKKATLGLYKKGNEVAQKRGLILVDTKYEFGEIDGKLVLIDEIHTPDSSRFWKKNSYEKRFKKGLEPENFDKEFFRIWYVKKGYRGDGTPPDMSEELKVETAKRYIKIYELLTGKKFKPQKYPVEKDIEKVVINILERKKNGKRKK